MSAWDLAWVPLIPVTVAVTLILTRRHPHPYPPAPPNAGAGASPPARTPPAGRPGAGSPRLGHRHAGGTHIMTRPAGYQVCCARCGCWWYENDPEVRRADGGWQCTSQAYCDARERKNQL